MGRRVTLLFAVGLLALGTAACGVTSAAGPTGPTGAIDLYHPLSGGTSVFWNRSRLLHAAPFRGTELHLPKIGEPNTARPNSSSIRVGALFDHTSTGDHFCTASVITSPDDNLIITAAHCINAGDGKGFRTDIAFIPDYRDGEAPYGVWTPDRLIVAPQWAKSADPDYDVGFVVLKPLDGKNIESVLGANTLDFDSSYRYLVRVTGYPKSAGQPITCVNWTSKESATQLQFDCDGYTDGTSGSPWVVDFDPRTRTGAIVGVVGGYQGGGDSPAISYSAYFGEAVQQLYLQTIDQGSS